MDEFNELEFINDFETIAQDMHDFFEELAAEELINETLVVKPKTREIPILEPESISLDEKIRKAVAQGIKDATPALIEALKRKNEDVIGTSSKKGKTVIVKPPPDNYCLICKKRGHTKEVCRSVRNLCFNCGQVGHIANFCTNPSVELLKKFMDS